MSKDWMRRRKVEEVCETNCELRGSLVRNAFLAVGGCAKA